MAILSALLTMLSMVARQSPGYKKTRLLPGGLVRALGKGVTALVGRAGLLY
jgi:hypothetical protein